MFSYEKLTSPIYAIRFCIAVAAKTDVGKYQFTKLNDASVF